MTIHQIVPNTHPICKDRFRGYELRNGDEFTVSLSSDLKEIMHMMQITDSTHKFMPIKIFRRVIWYKPRTWFRKYITVRFVEFESKTTVNENSKS